MVWSVFDERAALFPKANRTAQVSKHCIRLIEEAMPKYSRPYRIPAALKDEVSKLLCE